MTPKMKKKDASLRSGRPPARSSPAFTPPEQEAQAQEQAQEE